MKIKSIILFLSLLLVISCKDKTDDGRVYPTEKQTPFLVENNEGTVFKTDGQWTISVKNLNKHQSFGIEEGGILFVKNLPKEYQYEGLDVLFSGEVKFLYEIPDYNPASGSLYYFSLNVSKIESAQSR